MSSKSRSPFHKTPASLSPRTAWALNLWVPRKVFWVAVWLSPPPSYYYYFFCSGLLVAWTATATLHSRDTQTAAFPGFSFNSLGRSVSCCLAAPRSGHKEVEGSRPLEATLPACQGESDSPHCTLPPHLGSDLPGLLLAFSGEGEIVLHTKSGTPDSVLS